MMQRFALFTILALLVLGVIVSLNMAWRVNLKVDIAEQLNAKIDDLETAEAVQAEAVLAEAEALVDLAFNLLGLFEALSLAVTVGGVVLTGFGLTRFNNAQNELEKTRKDVLTQFANYRDSFEQEVKQRENELIALRKLLEDAAESERQQTSNALLANALIPLGERQYKASDYSGALNTYNRALELDPDNPVVNQRLGYVYTQSGDLDEARHHYENAIDRESDFAPALAGLGFVYRRIAENLAKETAKMTLSKDDLLQRNIERDKLLNKSEELLLQALKISPKLVDDDGESWWGVLGGLYKRRGQVEQAIESYRQATLVTPQSSYGFGNLAGLYMRKGEVEKMRETYKRVEQIAIKEAEATQGNFWGYSDLIVSSFAIGKDEQALEAIPIAISIAPIASPYMLEGLLASMQDLYDVTLDTERDELSKGIQMIHDEIMRRVELAESDKG